jgi:hypothetical protein
MSDVTVPAAATDVSDTEGSHDISLLLGGPFFQLLLRTGVIRPTFDLLLRRILVLALVPWIPLLVLTVAAGTALGGDVAVPFLKDIEVHARFLVAIPLLVVAERLSHQRLRPVFEQFVARSLIAPRDLGSFDAILARARRWRNSYVAEALMLVVSFGMTVWVWRPHIVLSVATWYARPGESGVDLTPAGYWYAYAAIPIMRFLFFRWFYRLVILYGVLARISRLPLLVVPTHPDRVGGLAFLGELGVSLQPFHMAITTLVSGFIANQLLFDGKRLADFYVMGGLVLGVLLLLTLLPILFFSAPLAVARRKGLREYGTLSQRYVEAFRRKWVSPVPQDGDALLGSADVQSLADLATSYDIVREMHTIPVSLRQAILLLVAAAVPFAPLLLTEFPLGTLVEKLIQFVL